MKNLSIILVFLTTLSSALSAKDFYKGLDAWSDGNFDIAVTNWRLSANSGDPKSQFFLGSSYYNGQGVVQDYNKAVKWWRIAAKQGHVAAQFSLGHLAKNGQGVTQANTVAYMWYNIALTNGATIAGQYGDELAKKMTAEAIENAQAMARECINSNYESCGY